MQPQTSQRSALRQASTQSKLLWGAIALSVILLFILIIVIINLPTLAHNTIVVGAPQATPDANAILDRADETLAQADRELNVINGLNTALGGVLAFFAVVTLGLAAVGFSTTNGFRDAEKELRGHLNNIVALQDETQKKSEEIDALRLEMETKKQEIVNLQKESAALRDILHESITSAQTSISRQLEEVNTLFVSLSVEGGNLQSKVPQTKDPQTNYTLGRIYSHNGYYDQAIQFLKASLAAKPDFPEAHMELGLTYRRRAYSYTSAEADKTQADLQAAIKELEAAIQLRSNYEDALSTLGGLYRRLGDYAKTLEYYRKAVKADPNSSYALGNVASLALYQGDKSLAMESFANTEKIARKRIDALHSHEPYWDYYDLALAQLALGQKDEAKETYKKAIELSPNKVLFDGVLHNLYFLKEAREPIDGLEDVIKMLEEAQSKFQ